MINLLAIKPTQLKSALSTTALTMKVKEFIDRHDNYPDFADLDTDWFVVVVKQGDQWEQIKITNLVQETDGSATLTIDPAGRHILPIAPFTGSGTGFEFSSTVAEVIVTNDMLTMNEFAKLNNDNAFTGYNTVPDPVTGQGVVPRDYMLALINGGSVSVDSVIETGVAGETISAGKLVYLKSSDGRWWLCDADTASTVENVILGIAQGAGTAGNPITGGILTQGTDENQTGLTINTKYYASNTAGGISTTAGTKEVTIGIALSTTSIIFKPRFDQNITEDEQDAISGGSTFGTPSATNKFLTQDYNASATGLPVIRKYTTASSAIGSSTTQFDITNPAGTTFRYTWDSTGTDPSLSLANNPIGSLVNIQAQNFSAGNKGLFIVTGAGTNYIEVTNASGVVESDKTIGTGYIVKSGATGWSKPTGLKYITIETIGAGGTGCGGSSKGGGGGGGGYSKKLVPASSLSTTEYYIIGDVSRLSAFSFGSSLIYATGGVTATSLIGGLAGIGVGGDLNIKGQSGGTSAGSDTGSGGSQNRSGGNGGSSHMGGGGCGGENGVSDGTNGGDYGGGGGGGAQVGGYQNPGVGATGAVIITEYYS